MSSKITFFTRFNPPPSPGLECKDATLTRQEFVQECDLNNIMKRYAAGMPLPSGSRQPLYGDFSDIPDYARAFQIVSDAHDAFMSLPSDVRDRFKNDPAQLMSFLQDKNNFEEGVKLGLFKAPEIKVEESVSVPAKGGSNEPPPTTIT